MLKKSVLSGFMIIILAVSLTAKADINGRIIEVDDFRVLQLWGTHEEMGFAHGYLVGDEITELFEQYFMWVINPATYQNIILPVFRQLFTVPDIYQGELDGIISGIRAANISLFSASLNRNLTSEDLAVVNSIVDFTQQTMGFDPEMFGCSSICGWGAGTEMDETVPGGTIHGRNLDWVDTPERILGRRSMIIAYLPSEPGRQPWFSVAFPGFVACLSGMNIHGLGATLNMGNHYVPPGSVSGIMPICFQLRDALEKTDPNNDGNHSYEDIWHVLSRNQRLPSTIIHAFHPFMQHSGTNEASLVIESNHTGIIRRIPHDDPVLRPNFLAATNHHRFLYPPVPCWRYEMIQTMIAETGVMDSERAWEITDAVGGGWTLQTMLFRPDIRDVLVSSTVDHIPAPQKTPSHLTWDEIFATPTPTPTPTPDTLYVHLELSDDLFQENDDFLLTYLIGNPESENIEGNFWLILDVYGMYWFYPPWEQIPEYIPFEILSESVIGPITALDFIWPENVQGHASGLMFHAAVLTPDNDDIESNLDTVIFGYGLFPL